jgi:hypothetical protein
LLVAGSIARVEGWPTHPRLFFIDQVEDLAPLYAAARVVVLPITEGAGSPIKTYEALGYGRPIVGTSHAFRGLDGEPGEFIVRDDPRDFADAVLDLLNSEQQRKEAAEASRRTAAGCNDFAGYFRIMDGVLLPLLGGEPAPTPAPAAPETEQPFLEWSPPLQAMNRVVRSYLDGEVLEGWALDRLVQEPREEVDSLLEGVTRSLLTARDAAVLRTEQRLKRYIGASFGTRLRENTVFAVGVAIEERRGIPPAPAEITAASRVVAFGGLPLTVAGSAGEPGSARVSLVADGRPIAARRVTAGGPQGLGAALFQADIRPREADEPGLRTIEVAVADGAPGAGIAVMRHSVPIAAELRLLERDVFGGGFAVRADGSGAALPPGEAGLLSLPRVVDGMHAGYVDLCFAGVPVSADPSAPLTPIGLGISVLLGERPAELEVIRGAGRMALVRVLLDAQSDVGDFGVVQLTVLNQRAGSGLRLAAAYSGLLLGPIAEAAGIATVLSLGAQRWEQAAPLRPSLLAREAMGLILQGMAPSRPALDALGALASSRAGQEALRAMTEQELSRAARQNGAAARDVDAVMEDIDTIIASGRGGAAAALLGPALPFDIVDEAGKPLPAATDAALRQRSGSWRVPMPPDPVRQKVRIRLDAVLEIPEHPEAIRYRNFYPTESPAALFRWTGPEPTSTIAIPFAFNGPVRLEIELGSTGSNTAEEDFALACNGKPVAHALEPSGDGGVKLIGELSPAAAAGLTTEIALTVRESFRPEPPDRRVLGVVFRSLSLFLRAGEEPATLGPDAAAEIAQAAAPSGLLPAAGAASDAVPPETPLPDNAAEGDGGGEPITPPAGARVRAPRTRSGRPRPGASAAAAGGDGK